MESNIQTPKLNINGAIGSTKTLVRPSLELRSEEINDILSKRPAFIIRFGLTIIALIGILSIITSWYIKYPEVIKGNAIITTEIEPLKVISKSSGRLQKILVKPEQWINQGDYIAEIENTTRLENIPVLQTLIHQAERYLTNNTNKILFPLHTITFGDLQSEYNILLKNYEESERLLNDAIYLQRKKILIQQIIGYKKLVEINQKQVEINKEEFRNVETKYLADKKMYNEKVYGKLEFLGFENAFLQKKKENENYAKVLVENSLTLSEKEKQLYELDFEYIQKTRIFHDNIGQSIQNIDNLIASWKQNYIITAPSSGYLAFLRNLTENQVVHTNDTLMSVLPQKQHYIGYANVPSQNFGKVKIGQKVIIKLSNYPSEEYGSIYGTIQDISSSTSNSRYRIKIQLPHQLKTNFNKSINFRSEMMASAEIVTEDLRLLERFFYSLRKIFVD
ncbi:HlyD family secretion protein [Flectobacillus rivi]|uniref:HlyD family efflux transporter periplasmic adaptor subunit n=1 Tax=Flectobacillus rivi TaxID=2984209 RepID=A0ABT6YX05_9BACT|nr:HlyD family efflux transporter periplasmic adaptor subunit [Flectobacillus rivi]MDI9873232.1 HlyD family efflux transporter periplasmic adaptor subunit [Flectobacillus rivi]